MRAAGTSAEMVRRYAGGQALLATLLVLTILSAVVVILDFSTVVDARIADNYVADLQNAYALESATALAVSILEQDALGSRTDSLKEAWTTGERAMDVGSVRVSLRIADECGKVCIAASDESKDAGKTATLGRLLRYLQVQGVLVAPKTGPGLEATLQQSAPLKPAVSPGATPGAVQPSATALLCLQQLLPYLRVTREEMYGMVRPDGVWQPGLADYCTLWTEGKVNLNTAPLAVLEAVLGDIDPALPAKIERYRNRKPIDELDDLKSYFDIGGNVLGLIKPCATTRSTCFSVTARTQAGRRSRGVFAVITRSDMHAVVVHREPVPVIEQEMR